MNSFTVKIKIYVSYEECVLKSKHITENENTKYLVK
jgi:hypothetical protein